jgi:hypothetical protein
MKKYLIMMLVAPFLLIACEQKEEVSHERAELPAAGINGSDNQRTYLPTEDTYGDVNKEIEETRVRRSNESSFDAAEDMGDAHDDAADRRTYIRTEKMAEEINEKIEKRLDQLPDPATPDAAADVREDVYEHNAPENETTKNK